MAKPLVLPEEDVMLAMLEDAEMLGAEGTSTDDIAMFDGGLVEFGEVDGGTDREHVRWAEDHDAVDYDLLPAADASPFSFDATALKQLMLLNSFPVPSADQQPRVLFGLRGCQLADGGGQADFAAEISLVEATPDHNVQQCLMGVWDQRSGKVAAFRASTVPNWTYMWWTTLIKWVGGDRGDPRLSSNWRKTHEKAVRSNLLPTGMYRYIVGPHKSRPGCFRMDQDVMVLRTRTNLEFTSQDHWDGPLNPLDNIHPAYSDRLSPAGSKPLFDSAGCQTVPGNCTDGRHVRAWADFRVAAGLEDSALPGKNGDAFTYVLLTGREARLVSQGGDLASLVAAMSPGADAASAGALLSLQRLRIGSVSPKVSTLKRALKAGGFLASAANETPVFDAWTMEALILWQRRDDANPRLPSGWAGPANGKVGPVEMAAFGLAGGGVT